MPAADNIEYVGTYMKKFGQLSNVILQGQLTNLHLILRNAFKDMDKLPSGNVNVEHLKMQVGDLRGRESDAGSDVFASFLMLQDTKLSLGLICFRFLPLMTAGSRVLKPL